MRCEHCNTEVPAGHFCTNCGAHQATADEGSKRRHHRFAAHPNEHVFHPGAFTTLLPHLGRGKVDEFRWVFLGGLTGIFVLFFAGLITAALCVAVLLIPILYLLYLYEAQVYKEEPISVVIGLALVSVAIGIGVTLATNQLVGGDASSFTITGASLLIVGVGVPLIQEVVKPLPALGMRRRPVFRDETMDGLVFGIAAGLGFGVGESFVRFASILTDLPVRSTPGNWIYSLITTSALLPLLQGTCTGLVCAAFWRWRRPGRTGRIAVFGIVVALAGHVLFSLVSQLFANHGWSQLILIAWQTLVVLSLLVYMRFVLHYALLEEATDMGLSPKYCSHCHATVEAKGFCPICGQALTAVPFHSRLGTTPAVGTA